MTAAPGELTGREPVRSRLRTLRLASAVVGAILLVSGLPLGVFMWVDAIEYGYWPADSRFEAGPQAHQVKVDAGETFLLWKVATFETPQCSATEGSSGQDVALTDVTSGSWERGGGAVPYTAFAKGRSESGRITVSCVATVKSAYDGAEPDVYRVDGPDGPPFLDGFGPLWPAPLALIGSGLGLLAIAAVSMWWRDDRVGARGVTTTTQEAPWLTRHVQP